MQGFVMIDNDIIEDSRITALSFRVLAYIMSKPESWIFNNADLMQSCCCSDVKTMIKSVKSLEECGYITSEIIKEKGIIKGRQIKPITNFSQQEKNLIGKKPNRLKTQQEKNLIGKNGNHSNTDIYSNTDLFSNIEIYSNTDKENIKRNPEPTQKPTKHPAISGEMEELKKSLNELYHRRETTEWSEREMKQLRIISQRAEIGTETAEICKFYTGGYEYRRKDILTLLNNWNVELDRQRNFVKKESKDDYQEANDYGNIDRYKDAVIPDI